MTPETVKKILAYIAAIISAVGVIIGAIFTIDSRYVKPEQLKAAETTAVEDNKALKVLLMREITQLHKQVLDNEELRIQLGNSIDANKILAERNKKELEAVTRLIEAQNHSQLLKAMPIAIPEPMPVPIVPPVVIEDNIPQEPLQPPAF